MIIKSKSRKQGIGQLVRYVCNEVKGKGGLTMKHNLSGHDKDRWIAQLKFNESLRKVKRKDAPVAFHEIISFHAGDSDKINRKVLKDIASRYIELRGKENMFLIREHRDKEHIHLHAIVSATHFLTGKANRMSKAEFGKFKLHLEKYQKEKYPELNYSLAQGKNGRETMIDKRQTKRQGAKEVIEKCMSESRSKSDFLSLLHSQGHEPYYRNDTLTGIKFGGDMKFRFSKLGYSEKDFDKAERVVSEAEQKQNELDELRTADEAKIRNSTEDELGRHIEDDEIQSDENEDDFNHTDED